MSSRSTLWNGLVSGSTKWETYIRYSSNLYNFKFNEIIELFVKAPKATNVATFDEWNKRGFRVNYRAKAIYINNTPYFDSLATNAPVDYGRWYYKPDASNHVIQAWKEIYSSVTDNEDVVSNTINVCMSQLADFEKRYGLL